MEILIIVLAVIITTLAILLYISLKKEIKNIADQIAVINRTNTNSKVLVYSCDKEIRRLAIEVNKSIENKKSMEADYKRMDMELRRAIANVSHDLRTPLTSIMGYIQLMDDNGISEEERQQYTDIVRKRAEALQMLITGFYDLSRLESGEYGFQLKAINISNILCDIIASFYNDFQDKGIEPSIIIDEITTEVIGDENAVRRIFSNLIQNMLRYSKETVSISLEQKDGFIITAFKNDTTELTREDASHIFERFFTANRARNGTSTGLGLAITKMLVEQMGQSIYSNFSDGEFSIIIKWKI